MMIHKFVCSIVPAWTDASVLLEPMKEFPSTHLKRNPVSEALFDLIENRMFPINADARFD
jgi:hypothetical protein